MKLLEYNNYKKHILEYMTADDLAETLKNYKTLRESNGTTYGAGLVMVQWGCFACYFSQVMTKLAEIYGEEFDRTKYETKDGELRYKDGECYCWTIYKHKIAKTIEMMEKKGEL